MEHLTITMDPEPQVVQLATIGLPGPKLRYKDLTENDKEDLRQGIYEAIDVQVKAAEDAEEGAENARDVSLQTMDNIQNNLLPATTKLFNDTDVAKDAAENARDKAKAAQQQATLQAQASSTSAQQSRNAQSTTETARDTAVSARNAAKISENNAKASETKAGQHATNALSSENSASSSAATATAKATSATNSEVNAKASETSAKASEAAASQHKQTSATSASQASQSASASSSSASAASTSEANAKASENAAEASKNAAATSESNAASSESAASTSESNAKTSETNAKTSETNAKTSETNAAQSASEAAQSLTNVENVFNTFDARYLGPKASDPSVDNNGDPLVAGAVYWNTNLKALRFYNGNSWEDPAASAAQSASDALASKQAAASSASSSASSASAASASASQSAASAGQSQGFRDESQGFRNTASTKSNEASQSASQASQSANEASTHADKAKDYRDEALQIISANAITHIEDAKGVLHEGSTVTVDSDFVDAVSKTNGGTFANTVTFDKGIQMGPSESIKTAGGYDAVNIGNSDVKFGDTNLKTIIRSDRNPVVQVGNQGEREIYHKGNKPTPSDIGALDASYKPPYSSITGLPTYFPTEWDEVASKPITATRWPTFSEVTGKPEEATRWPTPDEVGLGNLSQGQVNELKITNNHGFVRVGALNSDYCHFRTDLPEFYFGKDVTVEGDVTLYRNEGTKLDHSSGNIYEHGKRVYSPNNKPSASDVNAVPVETTGDNKVARLQTGVNKNTSVELMESDGRHGLIVGYYGENGSDYGYIAGRDSNTDREVVTFPRRGQFVDVKTDLWERGQRVYSPHNKPSPTTIGAEPALSPEQKRNIYMNSGAPDAAIGSNGDLYIET